MVAMETFSLIVPIYKTISDAQARTINSQDAPCVDVKRVALYTIQCVVYSMYYTVCTKHLAV
jgi:hypothetical protein